MKVRRINLTINERAVNAVLHIEDLRRLRMMRVSNPVNQLSDVLHSAGTKAGWIPSMDDVDTGVASTIPTGHPDSIDNDF